MIGWRVCLNTENLTFKDSFRAYRRSPYGRAPQRYFFSRGGKVGLGSKEALDPTPQLRAFMWQTKQTVYSSSHRNAVKPDTLHP